VFFDGVFVVFSWSIRGVFAVFGDTLFDLGKHADFWKYFLYSPWRRFSSTGLAEVRRADSPLRKGEDQADTSAAKQPARASIQSQKKWS
jgi:hypothetical protein